MSGKTLFQSPEPELTSEPAVRRREKRNVSAVPDAKPLRPAKSADLIPLPLREKPASSRFAVSPIMDELLLGGGGGGEEDARSERSSCGAGDGGGRAKRLESFVRATFGRDVRPALRNFAKRSGLLTLSVVAVLTGCTLGFVLRGTQLSTQAKIYFSFPGELLMRMLKMLILPLITSSLMSGLSSMESRACCRMGVLTVTYYLWTTFMAVVVGIVLVVIIKPGAGTDMESNRLGGGPVMTSADALLDLIRNMVPSNLIEATFQQYKTDLVQILKVPARSVTPNFVYVVPGEGDGKGRTVLLELTPPPEVTYKTGPGSSQQMNVLGIVIFSATMGLLLGRMGERGAPLVNVCQCINECVMKIINAAVWYFPFGIVFLVAGKILDMQDPSTLGRKLGWYGVTVLAGLFVHGLVLLPLFYFLLTRKNPFTFIRGLLQALVIALATSSSSATLPITMKCLLERCHVDRQIARFVLPVGATINMDGTALYEAVAAIFIAQVNDYELDFGQLVTISITATAASIGAAGIPQAGLVTMVIVLTSVGLPPDDITLIVAIDWILDRFRTMVNVLGDALAAGIIAHLCRKDFPLGGEGKAFPSYGTHDVPMTHVHTHKDGDAAHTVYYNICQV
ncbi:excitatory amino acid transporter 5 isoform X1 [Syngnathoides biaculeatus]|uniref:excitatory amino acid transporter 5 isoform X1 n=1 Tax=Syngnathoides biaculeatus TaxID=300417 RepID=UPI002ADD340D|nr:excitatory amino acid transporter 5 isoform X1 [Syngnathoides biaculeatus]